MKKKKIVPTMISITKKEEKVDKIEAIPVNQVPQNNSDVSGILDKCFSFVSQFREENDNLLGKIRHANEELSCKIQGMIENKFAVEAKQPKSVDKVVNFIEVIGYATIRIENNERGSHVTSLVKDSPIFRTQMFPTRILDAKVGASMIVLLTETSKVYCLSPMFNLIYTFTTRSRKLAVCGFTLALCYEKKLKVVFIFN